MAWVPLEDVCRDQVWFHGRDGGEVSIRKVLAWYDHPQVLTAHGQEGPLLIVATAHVVDPEAGPWAVFSITDTERDAMEGGSVCFNAVSTASVARHGGAQLVVVPWGESMAVAVQYRMDADECRLEAIGEITKPLP